MTTARSRAVGSCAFDDAYLPLRELARYSGLSVRTLRDCLRDTARPLPHYRVGGKILVRRSEYDGWAQQFRRVDGAPLDSMVGELLKGIA
jgi:excisionase family DNA binding protein